MRGGESLTWKVGNPIMEIVVMCCDEASLLTAEGVEDRECCPTSVSMVRQVRGINTVAQEDGIPPLLRPLLRPIDCGGEQGQTPPPPLDNYHPSGILRGYDGPIFR